MTCKEELRRRLRATFPDLESLGLLDLMTNSIINITFRPTILGKGEKSKSTDSVYESWNAEFIKKELLPFEPSEEEMLHYTE
jgi:hypothetical protein